MTGSAATLAMVVAKSSSAARAVELPQSSGLHVAPTAGNDISMARRAARGSAGRSPQASRTSQAKAPSISSVLALAIRCNHLRVRLTMRCTARSWCGDGTSRSQRTSPCQAQFSAATKTLVHQHAARSLVAAALTLTNGRGINPECRAPRRLVTWLPGSAASRHCCARAAGDASRASAIVAQMRGASSGG